MACWDTLDFCTFGKPLNPLFMSWNIQNYLNEFQEIPKSFEQHIISRSSRIEHFETFGKCVFRKLEKVHVQKNDILKLWNFGTLKPRSQEAKKPFLYLCHFWILAT